MQKDVLLPPASRSSPSVMPNDPGSAPVSGEDIEPPARDADEIISPPPFRDPADFAPLPPPKASFRDVVELFGHISFVILVSVIVPVAFLWFSYRLYLWLPFETIGVLITGLACAWAYRERLGPMAKRILVGRDKSSN